MKKSILFIFLFQFSCLLWARKDYRQVYPGQLHNFIYYEEEGKIDDFMIRNHEKILTIVNENLAERHKRFIVQYVFGNFANIGKTEVVVFFNEEDYRRESIFGTTSLGLFIFDETEEILEHCEINNYCVSLLKKERCYECPALGNRFNEGWICDLNGNGKQELIIHHGWAMNNAKCILEYSDGELRNLLNFVDENTWVRNADLENHIIYFERYRFFPELKAYKTIYTKAVWDEKYKKYLEEEISSLD